MKTSQGTILLALTSICLLVQNTVMGASNPHYSWNFGKRLQAKSPYNADYDEFERKPQDIYYPFTELDRPIPPPIIRPDGTTKSRIPQDTLYRDHEPHFTGSFTSLDKHLKEQSQQIDHSVDRKINGLEPEEVYYADDDLLIIKGGGFPSPTYEEPLQDLQAQEQIFSEPYQEILHTPPSPHNEYNGNVPTIVKPPSSFWSSPVAASHYPPFALFVPARLFSSNSHSYYFYVPIMNQNPYNYIVNPHGTSYNYSPPSKWGKPTSQLIEKPTKKRPSFHGDTKVNYLNPKPSVNPDAELISTLSKPYKKTNVESYKKPQNYYIKQSRRPKL